MKCLPVLLRSCAVTQAKFVVEEFRGQRVFRIDKLRLKELSAYDMGFQSLRDQDAKIEVGVYREGRLFDSGLAIDTGSQVEEYHFYDLRKVCSHAVRTGLYGSIIDQDLLASWFHPGDVVAIGMSGRIVQASIIASWRARMGKKPRFAAARKKAEKDYVELREKARASAYKKLNAQIASLPLPSVL